MPGNCRTLGIPLCTCISETTLQREIFVGSRSARSIDTYTFESGNAIMYLTSQSLPPTEYAHTSSLVYRLNFKIRENFKKVRSDPTIKEPSDPWTSNQKNLNLGGPHSPLTSPIHLSPTTPTTSDTLHPPTVSNDKKTNMPVNQVCWERRARRCL